MSVFMMAVARKVIISFMLPNVLSILPAFRQCIRQPSRLRNQNLLQYPLHVTACQSRFPQTPPVRQCNSDTTRSVSRWTNRGTP